MEDRRQLIATLEIVADSKDSGARHKLRILALDAEFRDWLQRLAGLIAPKETAPAGNRLISSADLAKWLGGTANWHERHRQRYVDAGLLLRTVGNRRFVGDIQKIQVAIGDPAFWADLDGDSK